MLYILWVIIVVSNIFIKNIASALQEAPMAPSKAASLDQPVFMMRLGARFVFRISLAAGSRRGWVPLMVTGPFKLRLGFARSDPGEVLQVNSLS